MTLTLRLAAWEDAALEAATSKGLVRRARRDLEARAARVERADDREAVVAMGDAVVTLRGERLADAACTCRAAAVCRHVVGAILLLRDRAPAAGRQAAGARPPPRAPDPIAEILALSEGELVAAFGRALMSRARAANEASDAPAMAASGASCVVVFAGRPEARFLAGLGPAGMVCRAPAAEARLTCARALLAVRRAHGAGPARAEPAAASDVPNGAAALRGILDRAQDLLIAWTRLGLAAAPETLEDRLFEAAVSARAGGLPRLGTALRRQAEDVGRRRARDAEFDAAESLRAAARALALVEALRRFPDDPALRGAREVFTPIGDCALTGCGVETWRTPAGAAGATAHFYAPEHRRWFTATLARAAGRSAGFAPEQAIERDAVWGATLGELAHARVWLRGAAASPSGRLSLGRATQARLAPARLSLPDLADWPNVFSDWAALDAFMRAALAPSLRGREAGVVVLLPAATGRPRFDEIAQALAAPAFDGRGRRVTLLFDNRAHRQTRLRAAEQRLGANAPAAVFAITTRREGAPALWPYAFLDADGGRVLSLDRRPSLDAGGTPPGPDDFAAAPHRVQGAATTSLRLLRGALDDLLGLCELGARLRDPAATARIAAIAARFDAIGLHPLARPLAEAARAKNDERAKAILVAVHALETLRRMPRGLVC